MTAHATRTLADDLREVVAALDRRLPRVERPREADIARDSAALKRAALNLLSQLQEPSAPFPVGPDSA